MCCEIAQRPVDSVTSVTGYMITTGDYNYKDQPTCQNRRAIKDASWTFQMEADLLLSTLVRA